MTVRGYKKITSRDEEGNPTAYSTVIASLNVSSGGIVKGATVGDEGAIYVSEGANVSGLSASGGRIIFENAGSGWGNYFPASATVTGLAVEAGGVLEVNSKFGLTASNVRIGENAGLEFTLGKTANEDYTPTALNGTWTADWGNGTFQTNDGVLTGFGGQFGHEYRDLFYSSAYVSARLSMTIVEGGVLAGGDLRGYGSVLVKNGGKMLDTKLQGVGASIGASGYASGISATIASGKNAYGTNIYVYGSGAVADATVLNGGYMGVERGGVVNSVTMLAPDWYEGPAGNDTEVGPVEFEVMAGGTAKNVIASAGVITLLDGSKEPGTAGPTLSNADVHSAAMLIVKGDGAVLDGTLNLAGTVFTTGKRYEYVEVEVEEEDPNNPGQTIKYTDYQRFELNNSVADAATLTVNFDLTELNAPGETAMIDNLANLTGVTLDRITVKADQTEGAYVLAGGSEEYNGSLKVVRDGSFAGNITVGGYLQVTDDLTYSLLKNDNNDLVFSVMSTEAAITNIIATSDGKELLKGKWSKYAVNIKTEVNKYSTSIWYRIKQAVKPKTRDLLSAPGDVDDDGWIEFDNDKGIDITEYCTVELKAKNEAGADSEIVEYTVNYDATAPVFSDLRIVPDERPGASVLSVTVTDNLDDDPTVQISVGGGDWADLNRGEDGRYAFNLAGNDDYELRAIDHAENVAVYVEAVVAGTAKSDVDGNGVSDVMFQYTGGDYQLGFWMNGTNEWRGNGLPHPAEWEVLGAYDMNANGKADAVLVGNVEVGGVKGAYIGYYADSDDADANWINIGYLTNAEDYVWKNKVGNLTGGSANSIVWYAPELYALGAWTDGTDSWVTLSNNFGGDAWTLVGCGDFDGDGKDSVVMSYNGGQLFYAVGIDGTPKGLGSSNWSGWEVRAIGDFAGDGKDDMVLFHHDTGSMVMCADGNVDDFVSIGQLDANDWFVVGAGDYNGDQQDDLLVRQYSTGMLGYYASGDTTQWNVLGYGVGMEWTVIA